MTSAPLAPLRRSAGEKSHRTGRARSPLSRQVDILERDIADRWNIVDTAHRTGIDSAPLAVAAVRLYPFKLMTENLQREPLERFGLGPVDKRDNLFVNGHRLRAGRGTGMIMARRRRSFNPASPAS